MSQQSYIEKVHLSVSAISVFMPFLPENTVAKDLGFMNIGTISFQAASRLQNNYSGTFEHVLSNKVWFL